MKPLSEKLAELSAQAKAAEDRVAKAKTEVSARIEQQRDEVRYETEQALGRIKQDFDERKKDLRSAVVAIQAKVNADFEQLRQHATQAKTKFEAWQAENYAADKEADAIAAVDYAVAAIKIAELQTLDAIAARTEADTRFKQIDPTPTMA